MSIMVLLYLVQKHMKAKIWENMSDKTAELHRKLERELYNNFKEQLRRDFSPYFNTYVT